MILFGYIETEVFPMRTSRNSIFSRNGFPSLFFCNVLQNQLSIGELGITCTVKAGKFCDPVENNFNFMPQDNFAACSHVHYEPLVATQVHFDAFPF